MEKLVHVKAKEASKVISYNPDLEDAFIKGATWTVEMLARSMHKGPYNLPKSTRQMLETWTLRDIKKFVYGMLEKTKESKDDTED